MRQSYVLKKTDTGYELVDKADLAQWEAAHRIEKPRQKFVAKKVERGTWVFRDGQMVRKSAQVLQFKGRGLQIIPDIEPFVNVAIDNKVIGGRKQRRDMMRAHGVYEAGDLKVGDIKPHYDPKAHQQSVVNSLKKSLYQHGLGD